MEIKYFDKITEYESESIEVEEEIQSNYKKLEEVYNSLFGPEALKLGKVK